jgi:hypothetical protein
MRPFFYVLAPILFHAAACAQTPVTVVYTGRTLGYFRYPEQQPRVNFDHCVDDPASMSPATTQFAATLRSQADGAQLLVGLGDNFAMDLDARTFVDQGVRQPKDLWTWDYLSTPRQWILDSQVQGKLADSLASGYGTIAADNVGCFLRWAKYDAIVPGNADFYYGPERLRMLARFLMSDGQPAAFPKVAMLAANLAIVSTVPKANPRIPDYERERGPLGNQSLNYHVVQKQQGEEPIVQVDLPDTVLPYLRKIAIHNAFEVLDSNQRRVVLQNQPDGTRFHARPQNPGGSGEVALDYPADQARQTFALKYRFDTVEFCPAVAGVRDPYRLDLKNCTELNIDREATQAAAGQLNNDLYYTTAAQVLQPNADWGVCLRWKNPPPRDPLPLCQLFSVHAPFLQYPSDATPAIPPYVVKDSAAGKIAIFGVVDPAMGASIGRLNYAWLNTNSKYDSQIEVLDPAVALNQLMQECNAHEDCKSARKVLLAYMPAVAASNLVTNIDFIFDLVISQTDDAHETGDIEVTKKISGDPERGTNGRPPTLVTPGSVYNARVPGKIALIVQKAIIHRPQDCPTGLCSGTWGLTNQTAASVYAYNRPRGAGMMTLREAASAALRQAGVKSAPNDPDPAESWTTQQILERLATLRMQEVLHADLAMIQARDVFEAKLNGDAPITPQNLKEMIDRVYWKDDYALAMPLTGATLKALLKKSAALAAEEKNSVNIDLERGRALVPLGIFQELATKAILVNSQSIQDASLYSVAVTDYLAFGDTGYTEFLTPAVPPAFRLRDFRTLHPIASIVCLSIKKALTPADPAFANADCGPEALQASTYEDVSNLRPFDATAGYTAWRQFVAWAVPSFQYHRDFPLYAGTSQAEKVSQQKPRFSLTVEKMDLSVSVNTHQKTLQPITPPQGVDVASVDLQSAKFAGNPISQVTAPDSSSIRYDNRTRFRWSGQRADFFAMDDLVFAESKTQDTPTNPNYIRSLSGNALGLESGAVVRLFPKLKQASDLKLLVSERLDTELSSPLLSLTLNDPQFSTYLRNLNRTYRALTKAGFRLESANSWIEAGVEGGENIGLPYQYKFGNQVCPAGAGEDYHNAIYASPLLPTNPAYYPGDQSLLDCVAYYSYSAPAASTTRLGAPYLPPLNQATIFAYSPLAIYKTNRSEMGAFVNFSLNIPLPFSSKISYLLENKGDLFANGRNDLATDVHYFDQLSNALLIAARGNLSIKPEFDIFVYDGKVNGYKIHTYQAMLNLSYAFDWHSGLPLGKAMLYANPAPKTSMPPDGR